MNNLKKEDEVFSYNATPKVRVTVRVIPDWVVGCIHLQKEYSHSGVKEYIQLNPDELNELIFYFMRAKIKLNQEDRKLEDFFKQLEKEQTEVDNELLF